MYVIRITEYGVTLTKVYRKRGVISWPQKGKGFGQKGMEMLLEMILKKELERVAGKLQKQGKTQRIKP